MSQPCTGISEEPLPVSSWLNPVLSAFPQGCQRSVAAAIPLFRCIWAQRSNEVMKHISESSSQSTRAYESVLAGYEQARAETVVANT